MYVCLLTRSTFCYGSTLNYALIGDYLEHGLGDYGPALRELYIMACFREPGPINPELDDYFHRFQRDYLPSLPKIRFLRKKHRMHLDFEAKFADASFLSLGRLCPVELFSQAILEVATSLHLMDARITPRDAFDLEKFHQDVARLVAAAPKSDDELRQLYETMEQQKEARRAAMDPWERLGIEWDDFHPDARKLLNDPFFWEQADDNAPHGNDTGADLLNDFKKWNRRNPDNPAHAVARGLMRSWGTALVDVNAADESTVQRMIKDDLIGLMTTDEGLIAAAFAAVKHRGSCDDESRELALKAIERELMPAVISARGCKDPEQRRARLKLLAETLAKMPRKGG